MEVVASRDGPAPRLQILDARIPSLGGQLSQNHLKSEGLNYKQLIELTENGLLHPAYNSWYIYNSAIPHPQVGVGEGFNPFIVFIRQTYGATSISASDISSPASHFDSLSADSMLLNRSLNPYTLLMKSGASKSSAKGSLMASLVVCLDFS